MTLSRSEFDKLVLEHMELLYRLARRLSGDANAAEDLVQETYVQAYKGMDQFQLQEYGVRPWLIRILRNLTVNRYRRLKYEPSAVDDEALTAAAGEQAELPHFDPAQPFSFDMMDDRLAAAVRELPEEHQTALLLWAVHDLSYKEIAAVCDVPIGTVMSRLHRAREKLVERLRTPSLKKK
jgi:RNA polymerase sigma-70 factor (ECF subfamily)